ncbi:MAG: WG repeat-containing protein [Cyclobacteriaceae bacterium]|nr:WG repeat-containing protein [Cyclobacteriaceae bacterium]
MIAGVRKCRWVFALLLVFYVVIIPSFAGEGEEYSIIEKDHLKGLANKKGRVVIPPEYEDLGWSGGGTQLLEDVIGFKKGDLWGILNTKNERITEPVYTSVTRFNESWIVASKKLPYNSSIVFGVINARGNAEIAFQYHNLQVHNEHLIASAYIDGNYCFGLLDNRGKLIIPLNFNRIEAIGPHLYQVTANTKVAVFNHLGENLTDFTLDSVQVVQEDIIATYQNGKCGFIAKGGEHVSMPAFKEIKYENGRIKAQKIQQWQVLDHHNNLIASYAYDHVVPKGKSVYKVKIGEAEALIDASDSLLTAFKNFEILEHFGEWISVKQNDKAGVLHFNGQMFLAAVYDSIRYVNGVFLVKHKKDGKRGWSMVNKQGNIMTDQLYDELDGLGDSYYKAKRNKFWGVVNRHGKEIVFCKYDSIITYIEGKMLVKFMGEDGILNLDGTWEIMPQNKEIEIVDALRYLIRSRYGSYVAYYPETKDFTAEYFLYKHGERYLEQTQDKKYGLRDEEGNRVIRPEFDYISKLQEDSIYYARSGRGYSFITKSGKIKLANDTRFEEINDMSESFIGVKIDDRWGFVDINGKLRVANQYDNIGPYNEGMAPIKILQRWGYIDKREVLVVQPAYDTVYTFKGGLCEVVKKASTGS